MQKYSTDTCEIELEEYRGVEPNFIPLEKGFMFEDGAKPTKYKIYLDINPLLLDADDVQMFS